MSKDQDQSQFEAAAERRPTISPSVREMRIRIIGATILNFLGVIALGILLVNHESRFHLRDPAEVVYAVSIVIGMIALCVAAFMAARASSSISAGSFRRKAAIQCFHATRYCFWFTLLCCLIAAGVTLAQLTGRNPNAPDAIGGTIFLCLADLLILAENYLLLRRLVRNR